MGPRHKRTRTSEFCVYAIARLRSKFSLKSKRTIYIALLRLRCTYNFGFQKNFPSPKKYKHFSQSTFNNRFFLVYLTNDSLHKDTCIPTLNKLVTLAHKKYAKLSVLKSSLKSCYLYKLSSKQIPGYPPGSLKRNRYRDLFIPSKKNITHGMSPTSPSRR